MNVKVLALVSWPARIKTKMFPRTAAGVMMLSFEVILGSPAWTKDSARASVNRLI